MIFRILCNHKGTILNIEIPLTTTKSWRDILDDEIFDSLEENYINLIEDEDDEND